MTGGRGGGGGQEDFFTKITTDQTSVWTRHEVVSSAKAFMYGLMYSRHIYVFLNMGSISESFCLRVPGTQISHSTTPNRSPFLTADRIAFSLREACKSKGR